MIRFSSTIRLTTALAVLIAILVADSVQACPTCKDSLSKIIGVDSGLFLEHRSGHAIQYFDGYWYLLLFARSKE